MRVVAGLVRSGAMMPVLDCRPDWRKDLVPTVVFDRSVGEAEPSGHREDQQGQFADSQSRLGQYAAEADRNPEVFAA